VLSEAVERARRGEGPCLVEAVTYRVDAHTNADDATRYRDADEVTAWREHDPVALMERELRTRELLDDAGAGEAAEAAEEMARDLRERMNQEPDLRPMDLFDHVFARRTPQLEQQAALLRTELDAAEPQESTAADGQQADAKRGDDV
jgi:2-oxoisovalerate dehydrogenase E1 component alpha subunit